MSNSDRTIIWTDGGTPKNSPPFGIGYGSYKIGDQPVVNKSYFIPMSNNAAELYTIALAIGACDSQKIEIRSDSRIALIWTKKVQSDFKIPEDISDQMKTVIPVLAKAASGKNIKTTWIPRKFIFEIFGH